MTNDDAISYAILAMKEAGFSQHQARVLYFDMKALMDELTESEAKEQADAFLYAEK